MIDGWASALVSSERCDLGVTLSAFETSADGHWHVDRHVWDEVEEAYPDGPELELREALLRASVAVLENWAKTAAEFPGLHCSSPILIVDDAWLASLRGTPPPHVYICVARQAEQLEPVRHDEAVAAGREGLPFDGSWAPSWLRVFRLEASPGEEAEGGCWLLRPPLASSEGGA